MPDRLTERLGSETIDVNLADANGSWGTILSRDFASKTESSDRTCDVTNDGRPRLNVYQCLLGIHGAFKRATPDVLTELPNAMCPLG